GERGVLIADEHGIDRCRAPGILRPVDETEQIAVIEITEALHFVHRRNGIAETRHTLSGKLEAKIHALSADVEQQVAWRRDRMARSAANLLEGVQFRWLRLSKEAVPRVRPKPHHAGKSSFQVAKFHRTHQRGEVSAERAHSGAMLNARVECHAEEDRSAGQRRRYRLCQARQDTCRLGRVHWIVLHRESSWRRAKVRDASLPEPAVERPTACSRDVCSEWLIRERSTPSATSERLRTS